MYKYIIMESYCLFELGHYPFDSQNCRIILANQGNEGEDIELIGQNLTYLGPTTMKQYDIDSVEFEQSQDNKIKIMIKLLQIRKITRKSINNKKHLNVF